MAPSQVAYPGKAVLRTLVQMLPTIVAAVVLIAQEIAGAGVQWIAPWIGPLLAAQLALTRIMADPRVNALLSRVGLGAEPKSADVTPDPSDEEPVDGEIPAAVILERHFRVGGTP